MRAIITPILIFVGLQLAALLIALLNFIPSWEMLQIGLIIIVLLAAVGVGIVIIGRLGKILSGDDRKRLLNAVWLKFFASAGMGVCLLLFGAFTVFIAKGGVFPPLYVATFSYPDKDLTIFIYDNSFLDPETRIYVRKGILPLMEAKGILHGVWAHKLVPERKGDWLSLDGWRFSLDRLELEGPKWPDRLDLGEE